MHALGENGQVGGNKEMCKEAIGPYFPSLQIFLRRKCMDII